MDLAIELSTLLQDGRYGTIHRAGCKHLIDPEALGHVKSTTEAEDAANDVTGWGYEHGEYSFAPCVTL